MARHPDGRCRTSRSPQNRQRSSKNPPIQSTVSSNPQQLQSMRVPEIPLFMASLPLFIPTIRRTSTQTVRHINRSPHQQLCNRSNSPKQQFLAAVTHQGGISSLQQMVRMTVRHSAAPNLDQPSTGPECLDRTQGRGAFWDRDYTKNRPKALHRPRVGGSND